MLHRFILSALLLTLAPSAFAQRNANVPDPDPEIERKTFVLPEGFEVSLFAADPLLAKPIQMNFDSKGRLWIAASEVYPQIKPGEKANDKILILEDTDGDGKADKTTVFADGLLIPTAVEPDQFGGCYAADSTDLVHFSAPDPKTGKSTKKRIVLSGFGTEDTHHILHTFRTGPDCRLYMSQSIYIHSHIETPHGVRRLNAGGIWQFRPENEKLEVFARGWVNSWGTAWNKSGTTFATDGAGGNGINYVVPGGAYVAARDVARILPGLNPGSPKDCGLEVVSGSHLPADWQQNLITNDFRGHRVCRYTVQEDGSGFISREQKEVIKSNHPAFRPIDVKMGPDGAIYIADWYNPIIQHGEVDFRDPRRDKTHGRIWRVTAKGRDLVKKPSISGAKISDLLDLLNSPEDWTRSHARRELASRPMADVIGPLSDWLIRQTTEQAVLEALWVRQGLDAVDIDLLSRALRSSSADVRAAACRVAGDWAPRHTDIEFKLPPLASDDHARVQLEAVRALTHVPGSAKAIANALDKPVDRWLDYAIWLSLRETKEQWLPAVTTGKADFGGDSKKLIFALQAAGQGDIAKTLVALIKDSKLNDAAKISTLGTIAEVGNSADLAFVLEQLKTTPAGFDTVLPLIEKAARNRRLPPPKQSWPLLVQAIDTNSGPGRQAACRLAGYWKFDGENNADQRFEKLGQITSRGLEIKNISELDEQAAFDGFVLMGGERVQKFLVLNARKGDDVHTQMKFLAALVQLDLSAGMAESKTFMESKGVPANLLEPVFHAIINKKGGTQAFAKAISDWKLTADAAKVGIRAARSNGQTDEALVAALTKAGQLTEAKRAYTQQELEAIYTDVKTKGDPARGEAIYRRAELNCLKCHGIAGAGGQVGPDMTSIGASAQVDYLVESLLNPNAKVKEGYNSFVVTTDDDRIFTGIKIRETPDQLILRDAEDKEIVVSKKDKPQIKPGRSLMPEGLTEPLTRQEFVDLVRFLSELGKGPYLAQPGKNVRRFEAATPSPELLKVRNRLESVIADPGLTWAPTYATVTGELPVTALQTFRFEKDGPAFAAIRFNIDCGTAGKVRLKCADTAGVQFTLDGRPLETTSDMTVDLPVGMRTIIATIAIDKIKKPLRLELDEVPNSPARVRIVTGK